MAIFTTPELLTVILQEHRRAAERARLARIADCARTCCRAPVNLIDRMIRALRRAGHGR